MEKDRLQLLQDYVDMLWKIGGSGVKVQLEMREVLDEIKELVRRK